MGLFWLIRFCLNFERGKFYRLVLTARLPHRLLAGLRDSEKGDVLAEASVSGKFMLIFVCRNLETDKILTKKNTQTANGILTSPCTCYDIRFLGSPTTNQTLHLLVE